MALRKASSYSKKRARAFTRISKRKSKAYIKTVPQNKVVKFHIGNQKDFNLGNHKYVVECVAEEAVQIRDNALEAARMYITKVMDTSALGQYYLGIKVFPHHFLRENKTAAGAGADRLSSGMTHSYGIVIGRAARVNPGQTIFMVSCPNDRIARIARDTLNKIRAKLPCKSRIVFQQISD
ncbi:MAG: 50S ribosomal protein L16 [Nanoarchaeota archaeon]